MTPEQARGQAVDERADVWALGGVLREMLAGKHAFHGANVSDMIASVLRGEPSWSDLPAEAAPVVPVLRRCLEKDPARRYRDAADVMLVLEDAVKSASGGAATAVPPPRSWRAISRRRSGSWRERRSSAWPAARPRVPKPLRRRSGGSS